MKAVIICPANRDSVAHLAEMTPLATLSICGKPFLFYWIEHLVAKGATEILVLASDRPEKVRARIGDGARWSIRIETLPECRELTIREARKKYRRTEETGWVDEPNDVVLADYLPSLPESNVFRSYSEFFAAVQKISPSSVTGDRVGWREIQPGVWTGFRAQISPTAKLVAPCWIGDYSIVSKDAVVGPHAYIENCVLVDTSAQVTNSYIGEETYVGKLTALNAAIAIGNSLANWNHHVVTTITDPFLLSPLRYWRSAAHTGSLVGRAAAVIALMLTSPFALFWALPRIAPGKSLLSVHHAVFPGATNRTVRYVEFYNAGPLWRRWPQLWNIARGEFAWMGNRPITQSQAASFKNDFERMWLEAPIGMFSFADALGCIEEFSDETRAHASYYAAQEQRANKFLLVLRALSSLARQQYEAFAAAEKAAHSPAKTVLSTTSRSEIQMPYSR